MACAPMLYDGAKRQSPHYYCASPANSGRFQQNNQEVKADPAWHSFRYFMASTGFPQP
jgi:hypothetical protein